MCYIMTATGFTMLSSEEARRLYGIDTEESNIVSKTLKNDR